MCLKVLGAERLFDFPSDALWWPQLLAKVAEVTVLTHARVGSPREIQVRTPFCRHRFKSRTACVDCLSLLFVFCSDGRVVIVAGGGSVSARGRARTRGVRGVVGNHLDFHRLARRVSHEPFANRAALLLF